MVDTIKPCYMIPASKHTRDAADNASNITTAAQLAGIIGFHGAQ